MLMLGRSHSRFEHLSQVVFYSRIMRGMPVARYSSFTEADFWTCLWPAADLAVFCSLRFTCAAQAKGRARIIMYT